MNLFLVIPVALALAMDAFAVSIGLSVRPGGLKTSQRWRLAAFFGLFQFLMPLVAWLAGQEVLHYMRDVDHWVAFGLLFFVGGKMVVESFRHQDMKKQTAGDPTMGVTLILLSIATSIDAFAVKGLCAKLIEGMTNNVITNRMRLIEIKVECQIWNLIFLFMAFSS